jgi:hypothetical protein
MRVQYTGVETNLLAKFAKAAVICVAAALIVVPAYSQGKSRAERKAEANMRSVTGVITGADGMPAVGAVVQIKDMRTLQVRSFITHADGTYHFYELKMDVDYQISPHSGDTTATPKTLSVFDSRKEAVLDFQLEAKK